MESDNDTRFSEFLLWGFSEETELQTLLFGLFLSMYLVTFSGNLFIILATITDSHLHTSMYFFLSNLSFMDICLSSTTVPKMLVSIHTQRGVITYAGCLTQMYFFTLFGELDDLLLAVMAYDHFVAICHPLHNTLTMKPWLCVLLVLVCWTVSALHSLLHSLLVLHLSYCTHLEIPHFFCDLLQMVELSCSDTFVNEVVIHFVTVILVFGPFIGIIYSYSKISSSVSVISLIQGMYEAFSTCASHLSVVFLFYCSILGVYLSSAASPNAHPSATVSVMYTVVTPMLNPFIYSLRNKDVKGVLKIYFRMKSFMGQKRCL